MTPTHGPLDAPLESPRVSAERVAAAARAAGDHRREAAALTDLGLLIGQADAPAAAYAYAAAGAAADAAGDPVLRSDVDAHYGLFLVGGGRAAEAVPVLERAVAAARGAGDRFAEKTALERLGAATHATGDGVRGVDCYARALALAKELGDARHEAELYWQTAIVYADLRQPDRAEQAGAMAVRLFRDQHHPDADRLAEHLDHYRRGGGPLASPTTFLGGAGFPAVQATPPTPPDPTVLKMAWRALKAAAGFVGGGMRTVPAETRRRRLATCEACEHHTGTRCRLCGCFTALKSHLPHENCPIKKWPA